MAETNKTMLSTSLAGFYAQKAAEKKQERAQAEYQKEYEKAVAEQAAAQAAQAAEAEREKNAGGFFGGIGYSLEKIGLGFLSGIEGIWDYTAGGLAKLFGADDWAEQQIANDWVNYNHADEWFNPSEGWQFVGDVAGGIGTSLPAIAGVAAAGAITYFSGGTLSPLAASLIAGSVAGLGAAGRATKEAYDQTGELTGKEFGYGALQGITEAAIEGVSAGIGAGTGAIVKNISKSFGKEVAQSATRQTLIKGMLKGFAGEAFEEGVQAILEPYYKRLTYDPNAKNATFQEVAYAALVGGLSGAIMGGADISIRNIHGASRGSTLVENGKSGDVITTAEQISNYQTENNTDYQSFQLVQNTLTELQNSMQKTDGQIQTIKQKMLLGVLEQANTTAAFEPIITSSAENIYNNAEAIAARLNELGYTDTNGKPIQVTAEQLREGIDTTDAKTLRKTMSQALKTNSALRTLAVADAIGQLSMDTAKFKDATLRGQRLSTQADLNRFIEQATDSERQAVAEKLGIENWETLTNDVFQTKIAEFVANGGVESYQQEYTLVKEANSVAPELAKKTLPRMVNLRNDGTYRYTQGNTDIAVIKRGDTYYVYDYDSKRMSKPLSRTETNKVLREIHTNETNYTDSVRQHNEAQNRLKQQAAELDTFARENIADYKNASASGQAAIRAVLRQGKALGLQEDFVLSCARVSVRSGLRIVFSKEASFVAANGTYADGAIDLTNNRIIINPEAKSRSGETILIHELTHAIYNLSDGTLQVAEGLETMTDVEKENIRKRYSAVGQGDAIQVGDEINAHFAEQTLSNKNILERLVEKKPTVKDKILSFFKKAKTEYAGDEKLSGAAARLYRQYKKLFDDFAARNQRYLGVDSETKYEPKTGKSVNTKRYALAESDFETALDKLDSFKSVEDIKSYFDRVQSMINDEASKFYPRTMADISANERHRVERVIKAANIEKEAIKAYRKKHKAKPVVDLSTQAKIEAIDKQYTEAIANNDLETARYLVEQMALIKGYSVTDYRIDHQAPYNDGYSASLDDVTSMFGEDIYGTQAAQYFGTFEGFDNESVSHIQRARNRPELYVRIYRAVPTSIKSDQIRNGDWITLTRKYAEEHGKSNIIGNYRVITAVGKAKHIYTDGNSIHEFGYDDGSNYYYRDTKNFKKLADLITFDDGGNPIHLRDRFNYRKDDVRYALPETEQEAVDSFGLTYSWGETGYVLTDGTRLDFSGKREGARGGYRTVDHRDISQIKAYNDFSGNDAMIDFMKRGNIRIMPEGSGVNLSVLPTKAQEATLSDFISKNRGEITLDIDNERGETIVSVEYPRGTHSNKVLQDIRNYFENGTKPTISEIQRFRYALPETDSKGNKLSFKQRSYFANSKIKDGDGRLLSMYHGSNAYDEIHVFKRGKIGYLGGGIYLTDNENYAKSYAEKDGYSGRIYNVYVNASNPLVVTSQTPAKEILRTIYKSDRVYNVRTEKQSFETYLITSADIKKLRNLGYDAILWRFGRNTEVSVFDANQLKLISNKTPTTNPDIRYALSPVEPIQPSNAEWKRTLDTTEAKLRFPNLWNIAAEESETRNPTQIRGTVTTYRKIYNYLKEKGFEGTILDASSGLGYGTKAGIDEYGFKVDDIEPFPDKGYNPKYTDYTKLTKKYDVIVSNAVLNVLPQDQRDALVVKMGELLKNGGKMFINVRGDDVNTLSSNSKNVQIAPMEWYVDSTGSYQKGFTRSELLAYLRDSLGKDFVVQPTSFFGKTAAIVTKRTTENMNYALPEVDSEEIHLSQEQREFFKDSKIVDNDGRILKMYHGSPNNFTQFSRDKIGSSTDSGMLGRGFYFTPNLEYAKTYSVRGDNRGGVLSVYLNIKNPYVINTKSDLNTFNEIYLGGADKLLEYYVKNNLRGFTKAQRNLFEKNTQRLIKDGYDGVFAPYFNNEVVAFNSEQIKLTTNKSPTVNDDIRFALDGNEDSNRSYGGYSVGQRAHFAANNTGMRVYTKAEATDVINSIIEERLVFDKMGMYGELRGKDRQQVIDYLYTKLNTVKEGYRSGVALKIADFLIENTVLTDMYADSDTSESMRILSVLRGYMHKLDLKGIQSEIQYKFDNKNSVSLVWGAKEGGIAPDTLPQVLAEEGIFIESENGADIFFEMLDRYQAARAEVYKATDKIKLSEFGDAKTIKDLRQQIARDILNAYDQKGSKSKYAKLVEKYTTQINNLRTRLREVNAQNRLINSIVDRAQKMRDLKLGTFLNSSQYKIDVFKRSIETLAKLKYRGNFNIGGTRKVMAELRTWYTKENPILSDTYEEGIAEMLDTIANGTKGYTKTELQMINDVMAYFTNYVEKFNKVYRNGKWIDAIPEATRYIYTIHSNEQVKVGLFRKMTGSTYMQTFGDPMTVARRMDMYENGFYTEMLTELREATIDAEITEMEVKSDYEAFLKKNKKYLADATKQTVKYRGADIPRLQLIGLYMTLKRNHAQAGLAQNGFAFTDNNGKRVRVQGFNPEITEESDLRSAALDEQSTIEGLLTDADKEYITILEKAYNQDAKKLKADRDMQRLGFTNATEEYYYPIRRGNIAKNVDTSDIQGELDRVSSSSFNKDTVRGAKQELYIESADVVFNRHIHAVTQYAALSPAIETYNRLYNLDIGGNPNKPVSVATESANTWAKGNKYFAKLISDIQGIPSVSGEGMKALGFIRGSYAKFQLGANPKVWVTQLSSLFASSSILDARSITKGMFVSAKGVNTYCPLAKLRNSDNTAAMAQGVIDKVGKVSNVLMAPIGKMDRFVVRRLFGACQVQIEKNGGAKIGTETNKIEAGKLLKRVILETQQNTIATERSAAMRSGNEVMRTVTMFTADSMKVVGRVIDAIGEYSTLKSKLRTTTETTKQESLRTQIKAARKQVVKSVTSLALSGLFMAGVAQLFKWLYDKDRDEDETVLQEVLVDFTGNLFGGLPLIKDVYARIMEGYSIENYTYLTINDLLDSATRLFGGVEKLVAGDATEQEMAAAVKSLVYSVGQLFGIPTRNIYNVIYGLTKRINPAAAYQIDNKFYKKNYVTDLNKAIENDDTDMIAMLMSMILDERIEGSTISDTVRDKLSDLYGKGYSVLPKSISDTITYNKSEIPLSDEQYQRFKSIYSQAMKDLEKMIRNGLLDTLPEEKQVKAIKQLYDAYYYNALTDLVGVDERTTVGELSQYIDIGKLSVAFAGLSEISSDKNSKGKTITGTQKKNTVDYLLKQNLTDGERLLILCYRGYTIQNGDYKGYSAKRAKSLLLKYILSLRVSQVQKATIASKCGFTVRNGKIVKDF